MDASFSRSADPQNAPRRAAVLFEEEEFREPLRAAVAAAGADLAAEIRLSELVPELIRDLDASALVLNLEPIVDRRPDLLELILTEQGNRELVFNDAAASRPLRGTDRARWTRHLAAKIAGNKGVLPPRPEAGVSISEVCSPKPAPGPPAEIWILAASIGGPEAVRNFLSGIPEDTQAAFVLAQHIGSEFLDLMSSQLNQASTIPVRCAKQGDLVQAAQVLIVPVGMRFSVGADDRVELERPATELPYSPCIDQVMIELTDRYRERANAIIFSGMASDGIAGAEYVIRNGGQVWVQEPDTCVVSSMVDGALATGGVAFTGNPAELALRLAERCRSQQSGQADSQAPI